MSREKSVILFIVGITAFVFLVTVAYFVPQKECVTIVMSQQQECWSSTRPKWKIAIVTSAMGTNYRTKLLPMFVNSFLRYFFKKDDRTIFAFVDEPIDFNDARLKQIRVPLTTDWGEASMRRWKYLLGLNGTLAGYDYVVWADVDIVVREPICDDYMDDFVGVAHPQQPISNLHNAPFEHRSEAAAFIPTHKKRQYLTGSQYAGRPTEIQQLALHGQQLKEHDEARGLRAVIVDETHYLHYIHTVRWPDKILGPSYDYPPEHMWLEYEEILGPIPKLLIHGGKPW